MNTQQIILAGAIFFCAHLVSAVTGFGSNVLGLPLLLLVVGLNPAKQSLILLGALMYAYLTVRWWRRVEYLDLIWIGLIAGAGLVVGMWAIEYLPRRTSNIVLAIFILVVGVRGMMKPNKRHRRAGALGQILLFLGGIVHGAFTTGGPLIAVYCKRALTNRFTFRATLAAMWLLLAIILMIGWTAHHAWDPRTPKVSLFGLPFLLAGLATGEYLHHKVDEKAFGFAVNATLAAIGIILMVTTLRG